jgi:ATP-dependent DNA helicase RecQ
MQPDILTLLKKNFGYSNFRGNQSDIISNILSNKDTIVLMPTGGGKSICFQIPALVFEGTTLVISPLISLMKDQVDALNSNGISASFVNSSMNDNERNFVIEKASKNKIKLLYMSPETLVSSMQTWLNNVQISLVAIDEAHCISMWGHDFRPEYKQIELLRNSLKSIPFIALTAIAITGCPPNTVGIVTEYPPILGSYPVIVALLLPSRVYVHALIVVKLTSFP